MRFERLSETEARIVGLEENEAKKALKPYLESRGRYLFKTEGGNFAFDIGFKPEGISIKVHRKPVFVPHWLMWQRMEDTIRKQRITEKSNK